VGTPAAAGDVFGALGQFLICPVCGGELRSSDRTLRCARRHAFDRARQGYVNLLPGGGGAGTADTVDMVHARAEFLRTGHYRPVAALLAARAAEVCSGGLVVDAGAGTGYYLAAVLDRLPAAAGLAVDVSKFALRRAAGAHDRAGAIAWDIWRPLPIRPHAAALVLNVFAPRNGAQFRQVLRGDGALLVVTPTGRHLAALTRALGLLGVDARKDERLARSLAPHFRLARRDEHDITFQVTRAEAVLLARMGPSGHHLTPGEIGRRAAALGEPIEVTGSFAVATYRPRRAAARGGAGPSQKVVTTGSTSGS
jgi:23S rRNA (guanine745-N1)-methyltransferase